MHSNFSVCRQLCGLPAVAAALVLLLGIAGAAAATQVGVARRDITPTEPIRLTGYAARKSAHIGVEQKLWAKALAIGNDREGPAVLITLDNCGIAEKTWREVRTRLAKSARLRPEKIVIASSHTHSAPATTDWAPNIFVRDLTAEEQGPIDRYTSALVANLEAVALEALRNRQSGLLSWSSGSVGFAANRRTRGGPVDHALPVLKAETTAGRLLALVANYACHCTTLGGEFNHVCGDWAGCAQEAIEREAPGALALVTIGCGADANPSPRGGADAGLALAKQHGAELGIEVKRLLGMTFTPLPGRLAARAREVQLPFGPHFTRDQWLARSTNAGIVGYHARKWLARLDRGEKLPELLYYPITTWSFGDALAMVFLPGEVVVDYALRLKDELDGRRLWVTGYANYVPCYIPSRRILHEGGYEAEDSLWYYDRPARLSTNVEDQIVATVRGLVPKTLHRDPSRAETPPPQSPQESLQTLRTRVGLTVELIASEPLLQSPVAIDWDARGRLWVCEMYDYPAGLKPPPDTGRKYGEPLIEPPGGFVPGGRIKILTDRDGDGRYDRAKVFLDKIPFPTGVIPWGKGALICSAPDLLYAEDTDGDGRADLVRTNVTGFSRGNYQARVNGFAWGLDGWLHASSGLFGGKVRSLQTGRETDLGGRDFRYRLDTGDIEPVSGVSQFGRVRDDFGNWFGNDNANWLWHYPVPDHFLRRNPHVAAPEPRLSMVRGAEANRVFPSSRTLARYNEPHNANIVTSACSPLVYRDAQLGDEYHGNVFVCEPVHNLVHRLVLDPSGVTYAGRRAAGEDRAEFLSSTDNWFRPVQARTGPDGALYIVDMYRFVIEHPRWIAPERLRQLDARAGADMGRIYRVRAEGSKLRPVAAPATMSVEELAHQLADANGTARDLAHMEIVRRHAQAKAADQSLIVRAVAALVNGPLAPAARVQTLAALRDLGGLRDEYVQSALVNRDVEVRRFALGLSEGRSALAGDLIAFAGRPDNQDARTLLQFWLAASGAEPAVARRLLGEAPMPRGDARLQTAWLIAAKQAPLEAFESWRRVSDPGPLPSALLNTMLSESRVGDLGAVIVRLDKATASVDDATSLQIHAALLGQPGVVTALSDNNDAPVRESLGRLMRGEAADAVIQRLLGGEVTALVPASAQAAIRILGHRAATSATNRAWLMDLFAVQLDTASKQALRKAAGELRGDEFAREAMARWSAFGPAVRGELLPLLLARDAWTGIALEGVASGSLQPAEFTLAQRQRLQAQSSETIRRRAATLFAAASSDRRAVLAKYAGVSDLTGAKERGGALFAQHCAQCHAFRGTGHNVGPNLAEFSGKGVSDFVLAIFDPNAALNPNFISYNVETRDGRSLSGIVRNETATGLTLVQGGGVRESIARRDVASIRAGALSLMPEGLEQAMTPQDVADLIAWLKAGAPAVHGSASVEQATKARADFVKRGANGFASVVASQEALPYPSWLGRLPMAYCRQSAGQGRLAWDSHPVPEAAGATHVFRLPAGMGFASQPKGKFTLTAGGRAVLEFDVSLTDASWQSADGRARMRYAVLEANGEDSNGVLEIELPREWLKPGEPVRFEAHGSASGSQRWFGIYQLPRGS